MKWVFKHLKKKKNVWFEIKQIFISNFHPFEVVGLANEHSFKWVKLWIIYLLTL